MAPLVLITGSTGFIGSSVTQHVLKAGYRVRLVIRRADQASKLEHIFPKYSHHIEFAIVPDITVRGCYNGVMDGVEYILHLASPLPAPGTDDLLTPALAGTKAILEAASSSYSIRRMVITSSIAAMTALGGQRDGMVVKGKYHSTRCAASHALTCFDIQRPTQSTEQLTPLLLLLFRRWANTRPASWRLTKPPSISFRRNTHVSPQSVYIQYLYSGAALYRQRPRNSPEHRVCCGNRSCQRNQPWDSSWACMLMM